MDLNFGVTSIGRRCIGLLVRRRSADVSDRVFCRFQAPAGDEEEGGTEAGVWPPWQPPVVAIVAGVGVSVLIILCVAAVVCKRCVDRTHLPTRTTFERSVTRHRTARMKKRSRK